MKNDVATDPNVTITEVTRRAIIDWFTISGLSWWGRLSEVECLARLYDLRALPSNDHRCSNMAGDISMHRENWVDWSNDWVFYDPRLNLLRASDTAFTAFLANTVHPVVRDSGDEVATIVEHVNAYLRADGWQLLPHGQLSQRPIFVAQHTARPVIFEEPTGWVKVDRQIARARTTLRAASAEEEFQTVGLLCREALISAAQAVYDATRHPALDAVTISDTDAKRMVEAYLAVELRGAECAHLRKMLRAAVDSAVAVQHHRNADFRSAALCAEMSAATVGMLAILDGKRNRTAPTARDFANHPGPEAPTPDSDIPF